jgi:hypothetical protein
MTFTDFSYRDLLPECPEQARIDDLEQTIGELRARIALLEDPRIADGDDDDFPFGCQGDLDACPASPGKPILLLDLDGVIADFNVAYFRRLLETSGVPEGQLPNFQVPSFTEWEWPLTLVKPGFHAEVFATLTNDEEFWATLPTYPWTARLAEGLADLADSLTVIYLTSRPNTFECFTGTAQWLANHGFTTDTADLVITEDKGAYAQWVREVQLEILLAVDDKPCHIEAYRAVNVPSLLVHQPWNRDYEALDRLYYPTDLPFILREALLRRRAVA